jgi:hypothetical protein
MSNSEAREDFLEEDPEVPGQKFALLSFLSPEKVLADKNLYFFEKFLNVYEFNARTKAIEAYVMNTVRKINAKLDAEADALDAKDLSGAADVCRQSRIRVDELMNEFQTFSKENEKELRGSKLKEAYDDFLYVNRSKLEDEFFAKNEFRTTVRGLKVRGVYSSQPEAVARSKKLQRTDPLHNIFVGEVGKWLPWDPEPSDVPEQEYAEDQLNTLMKKYKENEEAKDSFQRERRLAAAAAGKKAAQAGPNMTVERVEDAAAAPSGEEAERKAAFDASVGNMFSTDGPADLAIARKLEKKSS